MTRRRTLVASVVGALALTMVAGPVSAEHWRHHRHYRPWERPRVYHPPPRVVYTPPPAYYYPPAYVYRPAPPPPPRAVFGIWFSG